MNSNGEVMVRDLVTTVALPEEEERLIEAMSSEELRQELSRAMDHTARALLRLAVVVRVMESRGEDVNDLRLPLLTYLRQIAEGRLLPQLVARFVECPQLIRRAVRLSGQEQQALAQGEGVLLVVKHGEQWTNRIADPTRMQEAQVRQVFASDHLRGEQEQILWLEARNKPSPLPAPQKHGKVRADRERRGLVIGRQFYELENVLAALADLVPEEQPGERTEVITAKVTEAEHRALRLAAIDGASVTDQIRRALRIAGLI